MPVQVTPIEKVIYALDVFRRTYNNRIEFVKSTKPSDDRIEYSRELNSFAWDMAADGAALARAVAELLGQPELQSMMEGSR